MPRNLMAALNQTPDGRAPKNPFDLMSFETFSQKGGQLNIVGVRDTVPNSDYRMSVDGFTRTIINNTANFARIKENYYFVHVPLGLISRAAYQTLVQRKEQYSALDFGITKFPYFDLKTVLKRIVEVCNMDSATAAASGMLDVHGFNIGFGALKLFDMLGYGSYQDLVESTQIQSGLTVAQVKGIIDNFADFKPTANRLAAYQCVWYHFFRNDIYDCDQTARSFNFDDVTSTVTGSEPTSDYNILSVRTVDQFIQECCQLRYVPYKKDIFMSSMPGTQFGAVSTVPINVEFEDLSASFSGNAVTPTGSFNGSAVTPTGSFVGTPVTPSLGFGHTLSKSDSYGSPLPVTGSDQGKHIQSETLTPGSDYFLNVRNDGTVRANQYADVDPNDPTTVVISGGTTDSHTHDDDHVHFLDSSSLSVGSITPQGSISINSITPQGSISINSITPTGTVNLSGGATSASLFDVLSLVEAQAIQKWRQKSMLAGNRTTAQFKAHHGVVPRHLVDHLPDFIGSVDNVIQITEITSQSDTASAVDESNLGEIAGRGYGASDNRKFNFHSDDYGILILLHAIVPENTYSSYGLDPGNTMISYSDFYQQEYMNIGLQAVPNFILNAQDDNALTPGQLVPEGEGKETFSEDLGILGYAPRYYNYKQYVSKVHGFFNPSRLAAYGFTPANKFGYADMQSFVLTRNDMVADIYSNSKFNRFVMTLSKLYVNPSIFDSIFSKAADNSEISDEFFSHVKFECDSLLPMSVLGLPQF